MKLARKIIFIAGLMMLIGLLTSCGMSTREKIESGLKEPLSVYPTKNLEDFYDKEGYRDSNFSKDDKGVWSIFTSIERQNDEGKLRSEGVILFIDRNTKSSDGYYYVENESKDKRKNFKKKYFITMKNNELILKDKNVNEDIKKKVNKFKFFVQFGNLNNLNRNETRNETYNSQAPNYSISYHLNPSDDNLKQIQKHFGVKIGRKPRLEIYGDGNFKSDTFNSNTIEYAFDDDAEGYLSSSVAYRAKKSLNYE
ncbi:tandem-type lipoprotein [Staphylococcus hyicus]|uniref:tandem-type lipoprotein n=1 Tax=Staphylococcus hyicus TaxID=1284 RepID=UPI00217DD0EA|nr:tandem-type lipoprotein [Staphylococcus hyicus]UWF57057.1 tandem-type lipoprotein [Staphylococcus hyicus]